MSRPRCYVTDLDGTLLGRNAELSEFTRRTVTAALQQGCPVSFATARSYTSSMGVVSSIPWRYPLILYNGALLFDPLTHKVIDGCFLSAATADEIIEAGKTAGHTPLLFCLDAAHNERVYHEPLNARGYLEFAAGRPGDPRFREVEALRCDPQHHMLIVTYIGLQADMEQLRQLFTARFGDKAHICLMKDQYIDNHYFLELTHPEATKERGLHMWANAVGHSCSDIAVFGDNLNDIGLFRSAGRKIAVRNAHPELAALADEIIEAHHEDGVANYIARNLGLPSNVLQP